MDNRAVKIYNHVKRTDGQWTMLPIDVNLDKPLSAARQLAKGNFKVCWYEGSKKKASLGHYPDLGHAAKAAKIKLLQLQGATQGVTVHNPAERNGRMPIDVSADAYLQTVELNRVPRFKHKEAQAGGNACPMVQRYAQK